MKKLYLILTLLGVLSFQVGCNNEWEDELYTQMVSLKAPIDNNVTYLYLKYQENGEVTYNLPVLISGSRPNTRNFNVKIGVDNDTIPKLNTYIYSDREDLYYHQLGEEHYEFASNMCNVPAGSKKAMFPITFKFSDLDLVEKYVLPVTIEADPSYTMNTYKGRNKALLLVCPFNDYSGSYTAGNLFIQSINTPGNQMIANTRWVQVVDEQTVFWYAGITEELSTERGNYKICAEFLEPTRNEILLDEATGVPNGLVEIEGPLRLYQFQVGSNALIPTPVYTITESWDPDRPFIKRRLITMSMVYKYTDYTTSKSISFNYLCAGTMTMQRNINTLVPEDMQAYYW